MKLSEFNTPQLLNHRWALLKGDRFGNLPATLLRAVDKILIERYDAWLKAFERNRDETTYNENI